MIGKTLNYISHHAIAILALVCSLLALAGASYAATQLPKNSVGNAQIKQGAVSPPKFSNADRRLRPDVRGGQRGRQAAVLVPAGEARPIGATARSLAGSASAPSRGSDGLRRSSCAAFATPQAACPTTTSVGATVVPNLHGNTGTHVSVSWAGDSAIAVEVVCQLI